jgi:hypothetical protein
MSQEPGSNWRPTIYDTVALPTELSWRKCLPKDTVWYCIVQQDSMFFADLVR